ncbi:MAG: 50S ribosomal protein L11 methyltransferase [Syntrophomonadaceae bacterium]|nr:50S ribosomal protein L11 methyltransferase [Syntrophomonadaceae bacterium]
MIWQEIKVTTTHAAADAVANLFHEMGFGGVVIEDPQLVERYTHSAGWDCYELPPEVLQGDHVTVKGYLPLTDKPSGEINEEPPRLTELRQRLVQLWAMFEGEDGQVSLGQIDEDDWAQAWKKYYHPVKISDKIVIKPSWENYSTASDQIVIDLDPGMAFGTGTHPTTVHCLRALERYIRGGELVADVGTGSGILAIAAAKLGAAEVLAVDLDQLATSIAAENIRLNGVADRVRVLTGDLLEPLADRQGFDLIVGNLVAPIVRRLGPSAWEKLKPGGLFIGAGIIQGRLSEVLEELTGIGFELVEITDEGEWSTVVVSRPGPGPDTETR